MSSFAHQEQSPNPPPATRNIWYLDQELRSWREGVITESICNDRSDLSTWTFLITTPEEKNISIKTTSLSEVEFDFKYVKNRDHCCLAYDFDSLLFPNEPEILRFLSIKYSEKKVFHRVGNNVSIAINPCGFVDDMNVDCEDHVDKSSFYRSGRKGCFEENITCAYDVADAAFNSMCADKYNLDKRVDQMIFVRGTTGSGKSQNAKFILQYLLSLSVRVLGKALDENMSHSPRLLKLKGGGASSRSITLDSSLEGRFSAVNTILESLGNACRQGNSNSSRFGRIVELSYAADCYIEHMSVESLLLETERVHTQSKRERNFHIFYELAAGASAEFKAECGIEDVSDFHYTNQGDVLTRFDNVSDAKNFQALCRAFDMLEVSDTAQEEFLKCIAGVLHMGNITFEETKTGKVRFNESSKNKYHLDFVCRLLSTSKGSFQKALSKGASNKGSFDEHDSNFPTSVSGAEAARNHLAKTIYQQLMQWVLHQFKKCTHEVPSAHENPEGCISKILVIDFFGTESLRKNSFNHFCINYCSERVYEHFVNTVFTKEQERYVSEGIDWAFIPYTSNKSVIDMYDTPDIGLMSILETEAHMPNPTDEKLFQLCFKKIESRAFKASQKKSMKFTIMHHAGNVIYDGAGFTERNKVAQLTGDIMALFSQSTSSFVNALADTVDKDAKEDHMNHNRLKFVSTASRTKASTTLLQRQMDSLIVKSKTMKQHWLICLKPSASYAENKFVDAVVLDQIIDSGLVPLVALKQKGYSHEMSFQSFVATFYDLVLLAGKCIITRDFLLAREERDWQAAAVYLLGFIHITEEILNEIGIDVTEESNFNSENKLSLEESVVFAEHSVFIKRAMYHHLELLSDRIRVMMVVKIQRHVRIRLLSHSDKSPLSDSVRSRLSSLSFAYFSNATFVRVLKVTNARIVLQRFAQEALIFIRLKRRNYLIVKVQAHIRGHFIRRDLRARLLHSVTLVQHRWKFLLNHKKFLKKWNAVLKIQKRWKKYKQYLFQQLQEKCAIAVQRNWRSKRKARRELKRLETAELYDEAKQQSVKEEFLATLDEKLAQDPLYLINLLRKDEEVARLTSRVEEVKKLAMSRSLEVVSATTKLKESLEENRQLEITLNANTRKESSSNNRDRRDLLQTIDKLQKWITEKEKTRLRSLEELATTDTNMTSMMFDAALDNQKIADLEATLVKKAQEFKDYEFSLVKTSKNAQEVDYETEMKRSELLSIQNERDHLHSVVTKEMKKYNALKSFCTVLQSRIQANSPEMQMAEMQFGLQALQNGVSKLFAKGNSKERLKAVDNEANLAKSQKRMARKENEKSSPRSAARSSPSSNKTVEMSFRHFKLDGAKQNEQVLPKYTSFAQLSQEVASAKAARRNAKVKNLSPPTDAHGHKWKSKYLSIPTWCMICKEFISGITTNAQHAFKCRNCKIVGHRDCCHNFKCRCQTVVFDHDEDMLVPADLNDHLWESQVANVEDKCDLCDKYISDTIYEKMPFKCRRCKVVGHRDCCAKYSLEMCGDKKIQKRNKSDEMTSSPQSPRSKSATDSVGRMVMNEDHDRMETLVDAISHPSLKINLHNFVTKYFRKPTWCFYCKKFVVGVTLKQQDGVKCSQCKVSAHRKCAIEYNQGLEAKRHACELKKK